MPSSAHTTKPRDLAYLVGPRGQTFTIQLVYYLPVASRLRPADTMTAHTGFLIFRRKLEAGQPAEVELEE